MKLAIVIPIHNEVQNLPELTRRLTAACAALTDLDWQVIYVNDGSTDDSVRLIEQQMGENPHLALLELSRNFGHQAAIAAGLAHADADAAVVMDGDLQDPPEVIPELVAAWRQGAEVVVAHRRSRAEHGLRRLGFEAFHRFFGWVSDFPIPANTGTFGLLARPALAALNSLPERNRFFPGLRAWIGFEQRQVEYDRQDRAAGTPAQTLRRLLRYAMDGVFSFSYKPLRLMMWGGVFISAASFILAMLYVILRFLKIGAVNTGFTTVVTVVLFLGGVQLIAIGLLGEYLGRIYDEVKGRPLFMVKRRKGFEPSVPMGASPRQPDDRGT